jgi:predicted RNA-binding Zn-ribbon protein involved in translation (DUF1610 family)
MSDGWLSDLSAAGTSAGAKVFGREKGSGYPAKTAVSQSPLVCPKCGAACSGTAERKRCSSCGFSSDVQRKTAPKLGVVENPCPACGAPLTIVGERRRCNACGTLAQTQEEI